jgi:DNA-binding winged helix-turn-helix (wHTH) protein
MTASLSVITPSPVNPSLEICSPDGEKYTVPLKSLVRQSGDRSRITVGRNDDNDLVLADRYKMVSRWQCTLEYASGRWWIADEGSANGTFVRKNNSNADIDVRMEDAVPLRNGDEILVLGKWTESDRPIFWHLHFCDFDETIPVKKMQLPVDLEYNFDRQQLFQVTRQERNEVKLSNQERSLIHHMALKNRQNNGQPILCIYEDLITTIWGDSFGHSSNEINRLVWSIRNKIEADPGEPRYLKTVKGKGYLLDLNISNSQQ